MTIINEHSKNKKALNNLLSHIDFDNNYKRTR